MKNILHKLFKPNKGIAIWGWWQGGNLGDNWIKQVMAKAFTDSCFISTDTPSTDLNKYSFLICGGGGLFIRDVYETWKQKIVVPFGAIGLGAEFSHKTNAAFALSQRAQFFFARDQYSIECMHLSDKHRSYDMTFFDPLPVLEKPDLGKILFIWRAPEELLVYDDFIQYIGKSSPEQEWIKILKHNFQTITTDTFLTTDNYIKLITDDVEFIISARYHGIIAAIQRGIPCIGIDICPKIRALLKECGLENFCLKLSEVNMLEKKINEGRDNAHLIRQKQLDFAAGAHAKVTADVNYALKKIRQFI